jgi:hypothetical protein
MSDIFDPDKEKAREGRRRSRAASREMDLALISIMESTLGRKWIWYQLSTLGVFHSPFGSDVYMSYFAGGEKNVGLRLFADLMRVCPNLYLIMAKEHENVERSSHPGTSANTDASTDSGGDPEADSGGDSESGG